MRHSLRTRITVAVVGATLATLLGVGLVIDHLAATDARERLRTEALTRLDAAILVWEQPEATLRYGLSIDGDGVPPALADLRAGSATYYTGGRMWAGRRLDNGRVATLALSDAPVRAARADLRRQMLVAGGAAVPLTGLLGFAVATGLSRRLRRAAAAVAAGDTARLSVGGRDEVAALAGAVDEMAAALDDRLRAEQAFSADVAHELRTPVAGLVSAAELLPPGESTDLVRRLVDRLRRLVEDLLEVARLESGAEEVALTRSPLSALVPSAQVVRDADVLADPRRVERIVTNLLANAERHGDGEVAVTIDGPRLVVRDRGRGFPPEILERGAIRFHSTGRGSGLGLTIVQGQARALGASVELRNPPDGGAEVTVTFRSPDPSPGPRGRSSAG